jgi:N-acetylmuramoyl-L-alanine amidase
MRYWRIGMLAFTLAWVLPAHAVDVRAVRLTAGADGTRVILELSGNAHHTLFALKNPDRVVIDVADARLAPGSGGAPAGAGVVKQIRMGRRPSGELRVVLDLTQPIRAKSFVATPGDRAGYRLEIDLGNPPAAVEAPIKAEHARPEARDLIVAIDAGHGGEDPGAIGEYGTREKDVTLAIARDLARDVDGEPGMRAVLTRNGDYFVPLRDRMRRARAQQADLFVSIHADSIRDRTVDGSSVYILSQRGATSEAARWLAERQNAADLIGGVKLEDKGDLLASVLLDLSQTASLSASHTAAEHVLHQLNMVGEVRRPLVQQAGFMVLKSPDIPSMLVETAYISNPTEERKLRGLAHQAKIADAIHHGIRDYFYSDPPAGSRVAQLAAGGARVEAAPRTEFAPRDESTEPRDGPPRPDPAPRADLTPSGADAGS